MSTDVAEQHAPSCGYNGAWLLSLYMTTLKTADDVKQAWHAAVS